MAAALAGCGDDNPSHSDGGGGAGGMAMDGGPDAGPDTGGSGGAAGTDGGSDAGETARPCYMVAFTAPVDGAMLTATDDKDSDSCANGFQIDVTITTDAPDQADVSLFGGGALLKAGTVSNGSVTFSDVQLASSGDTQLSIQFPGREACTAATTKATVSVDCHVPTCTITKPVISAAHPKLNGVPAPAGDRVSATGSTYQAAFEVTTDVEDGQTVSLLVDDAAAPTSVTTFTAMASGGKATFPGVALAPDASYEIQASCPARNGVLGRSMKGTYIVDTTPPSLTVSKPTDAEFFGPTDLVNGNFQVCGSTISSDAAGLGPGLGAAAQNLCAFIGGSPLCAAVAATGASTCIDVPCTGGAPFDITVVLNDDAGNTTSTTINAVACASSLPSVQIITPLSDAPSFGDSSKHLLAASNGQTDVVACTNRAGTAILSVGHMGDATLTQLGSAVSTAAATSGCPAGFGFQATFANVVLPESLENADGTLLAPTELRVDVTDVSTATGSSLPLDVWVDSVAPAISLLSPAGLCGSFNQAMTTYTTAVQLTTDTPKVTLTVTNGGSTDTRMNPTYAAGVATFSSVAFDQGQSTLAAVASDYAGNSTTLAPSPCTVEVGMAPVVVYTTPTAGQELCADTSTGANCIDDADPVTGGWQGDIAVHVTGGGSPITTGNVTFSVGATTLGVAALDASGNATLANVTINDGMRTIVATTDNVPGRGVGTGTVSVLVDTGPPGAPAGLAAAVLDRRQTSFQLSWNAPGDMGAAVSDYQVRVAKVAIDASNFDDTAITTDVPFTGSPATPGTLDGIAVKDLYIENGYFFAVRAVDAAGNLGPITATTSSVAAHFNATLLNSPAGTNQLFGATLDGSGDVNKDGLSDLLVGTNNDTHAYLFLGATGFSPTTPAVTFTGAAAFFGATVRYIGDIDKDGFEDLAIADLANLRVLIYKGRSSWPGALNDTTDPDYVITASAAWASSAFGFTMARLGDFDGDGTDDFVIGAPGFTTSVGRVVVIYGQTGFTSFTLPDTTRSLEIGGDPALNRTQFGAAAVGLGHFYGSIGTTLVVSGPGLGSATSTSNNEGRIYAFRGRGPGAAITATSADNVVVGPGKPAKIGQQLINLGPMVNTLNSLGAASISDNLSIPGSGGAIMVMSGTDALGPMNTSRLVSQTNAIGVGQVLFGGGVSGRDTVVSLIGGDAAADLAATGQTSPVIEIIDGRKLSGQTNPFNLSTVADVSVPYPAGWTATASGGRNLMPDVNGDGYPDFALADQFGTVPGRVAVFW